VSLRVRLVLVVLVLTGVGLVVSGVATTSALRSYLLQRLDARLIGVEPVAVRRLSEPAPPETTNRAFEQPQSGGANLAPPGGNGDVLAARFDANGALVRELVPPFSNVDDVLRSVPASLLQPARTGQTVWSETTIAGVSYRVVVEPIGVSGDVAVVMAPLGDINDTVGRLELLAVGVGGALLVAAAGFGLWLVKVGLRPLAEMAETADAIAVGDLDRRVEARGKGEVERLAHALNNAFDARQGSEGKLRRFVTDASHELRTPLTSIRGYAELLRRGAVDDPEDRNRAVKRIEDEAIRMGGLVDDLLLLARLDQGRPVNATSVNLTTVAEDAVSDARAVDPARPVSLDAPDVVPVEVDEARLRQVLANLLANAREHTPPGTAVDVSVRTSDDDAVVTVTDHGPGLAIDAIPRVFDRFWRADDARGHRAGSVEGSGLGLAIVQAITVAHGGRITAANGPGGGAQFTITLPMTPHATSHKQLQGAPKDSHSTNR
jgi:two-component system OmpR family sensor kinase